MIRIALVGSIGSGKSHIAKLFKFKPLDFLKTKICGVS